MDNNYTAIIAKAFQTVMETFAGTQVTASNISEGELTPQDIMVMICMEGDVDGHVYMSLSAQAGKEIASNMLGGMELEGADEIVVSAVSELCNMVMGNACTDISIDNKNVDITPPVVVPMYDSAHTHNMFNIKFTLDKIGNAQLDLCFENRV